MRVRAGAGAVVAMVTLDDIRREDDSALYPSSILEGCESALVLFAAGFLGRQDCVAVADAGLTATCVDNDHARLGAMVLAYPERWEYVHGDAFAYARMTRRQWDVVSLDPFTNQFQRCADELELWCSLARRFVVLGVGIRTHLPVIPAGWLAHTQQMRSGFNGGVLWQVLERC